MVITDVIWGVINHSNAINTSHTCPDISDHFEHTHSHSSEDFVALNETQTPTIPILFNADFISVIHVNFKNNFNSAIWQPPKIS